MAGLDDPATIDVVTHDPVSGQFVLVIAAHEVIDGHSGQSAKLLAKVNRYVEFVQAGHMIRRFPDAEGKGVRIRLDVSAPPTGDGARILHRLRDALETVGVGFEVGVV